MPSPFGESVVLTFDRILAISSTRRTSCIHAGAGAHPLRRGCARRARACPPACRRACPGPPSWCARQSGRARTAPCRAEPSRWRPPAAGSGPPGSRDRCPSCPLRLPFRACRREEQEAPECRLLRPVRYGEDTWVTRLLPAFALRGPRTAFPRLPPAAALAEGRGASNRKGECLEKGYVVRPLGAWIKPRRIRADCQDFDAQFGGATCAGVHRRGSGPARCVRRVPLDP